jgi:hypothetical protein
MDDTHPLRLAVEIKLCKRKLDGFVLAAEALLAQAEEERRKLEDLEDVWNATHDAERELDKAIRRRSIANER